MTEIITAAMPTFYAIQDFLERVKATHNHATLTGSEETFRVYRAVCNGGFAEEQL